MHVQRSLKTQRGYLIYRYTTGDLKLIVNEPTEQELSGEDSGERVAKHIRQAFAEYLDRRLPAAFEKLFDCQDTKRAKSESMVNYIARKRVLIRDMDIISRYHPN